LSGQQDLSKIIVVDYQHDGVGFEKDTYRQGYLWVLLLGKTGGLQQRG
jgi:hypothetical protein